MEKKDEKKAIDFKYNLKEYFSFVKKYKLLFWTMILASVITEALLVADKFLYKWLIDDAGKYVAGTLAKNLFVHILLMVGIVYFAIVIIRSFSEFLSYHLLTKIEPKIIYDMKKKYFSKILILSDRFHSNHKTGSLISKLDRGAIAAETMMDIMVFNISPLILQFIMVFFSVLAFSTAPAIVLFIIVVLFISYSIHLQNLQKIVQVEWNTAKDRESSFIADIFSNMESIKYFGKEKRINHRFKKLLKNTRRLNLKYLNYFVKMNTGQELIIGLGVLVLLYFPLVDFIAGKITLGTIVFIYALYGNITGNLFGFTYGIKGYYKAMADMQGLFQYNKETNDIKDKPNAKNLKISNGEIEFKNISFGYKSDGFFRNFNLKIKPMEKIALVGRSGCGKTTLVKLLNRLYDVQKGSILIDGKDIREFKQQSLRSETAIVPQECLLFDDTIYNNIKFADSKATRKQIMRAIKLAQLDEVIKNLPKTEDTIVGERGVKLSGGEKQRVSIARAILANKKVLILDEATSSLDSKTEHEIQKALSKLLEGRTSIIIAHRLSTIMNSDRIVVLKKGKIVEDGTHKELVKKKGEYYKLWILQKGGYSG